MILSHVKKEFKKEFEDVLDHTKTLINDSKQNFSAGQKFEEELKEKLEICAHGTRFKGTFEVTGKQTFPDIISTFKNENILGIEVKTSQNDWRCFGNSIFEGTKVSGVDDIYLFFALIKNKDAINCKWLKYQDCIDSIKTTHSPRFHINMELGSNENIFSKMGMEYKNFSLLTDAKKMEIVRKLEREKGDDVPIWWLQNDRQQEADEERLKIRIFEECETNKKRQIIAECLALFPEIITENSSTKYRKAVKWVLTEYGMISHSFRDSFSAGGSVERVIQGRKVRLPRVFKTIDDNSFYISQHIAGFSKEDISKYWGIDCEHDSDKSKLQTWIDILSSRTRLEGVEQQTLSSFLMSDIFEQN